MSLLHYCEMSLTFKLVGYLSWPRPQKEKEMQVHLCQHFLNFWITNISKRGDICRHKRQVQKYCCCCLLNFLGSWCTPLQQHHGKRQQKLRRQHFSPKCQILLQEPQHSERKKERERGKLFSGITSLSLTHTHTLLTYTSKK